jgi:hypothetical protein
MQLISTLLKFGKLKRMSPFLLTIECKKQQNNITHIEITTKRCYTCHPEYFFLYKYFKILSI